MSIGAMDIEPINATQQSLVRIFSDEYAFAIPPYQRPYAWEEAQARELLDDVTAALDDAVATKDPVTYFLGSIVLIKRPGAPNAQVVDGQQRLTTLTILLSVLRDLSTGRAAHNRHSYICEVGDPDKGNKDRFRLIPRRQDADFFQEKIQEEGRTSNLLGNEGATESQKNMIANAMLFREELADWSEKRRDDLVAFLIQRCYLVVISVASVETAHRVFTVLNARGLDLAPTDILKADLLERAERNEERFAEIWEGHETALGRERFVELFQHTRMIYQREKPRERLEIGFPKFVATFKEDPDRFVREVLTKYAHIYELILSRSQLEEHFGKIARDHVASLLRLDNSDWLPLAIYYLSQDKLVSKDAEEFLGGLERLGYFMFVMRHDINTRITRYARTIGQFAQGKNLQESDLALTSIEKTRFLDELNGPIYEKTRVRLPVLLCLDAAFSDGGVTHTDGVVTVEHVMPQNPRPGSRWLAMFESDDERYDWTHKIGNLVLLTRAKNSQASNWEFNRKKSEYFSTKAGVASFRLTTMVLREKDWDRNTLGRRQQQMLTKLADMWNLDYENWHNARNKAAD